MPYLITPIITQRQDHPSWPARACIQIFFINQATSKKHPQPAYDASGQNDVSKAKLK